MRIRRFAKDDLPAVKALIDRTIEISYKAVYPMEAIGFFKDHHSREHILTGAERGYSIVMLAEKRTVGTGTLVGTNIRRVFVDSQLQGKGIGKMIMKDLEDQAKKEGIEVVDLESALVSKGFYDLLGYNGKEQTHIPLQNSQKLIYYKMNRRLTKRNS